MTDNLDPMFARTLIGHVPLVSGELVTVHATDDSLIIVALYAPADESADADADIVPAPVLAMRPSEAAAVSGLIKQGAVGAYGQRRPKLRVVKAEGVVDDR